MHKGNLDPQSQSLSGIESCLPRGRQQPTVLLNPCAALCLSLLPSAERMFPVSECPATLREGKIRRQHLWPIGKGNVSIIVTTRTEEVLRMGNHQF